MSGTPTVVNDPTKKGRFNPDVVSTMTVTERLNSIPKMDLLQEEDGEVNETATGEGGCGILDQGPSVDVAQFQKNLSGKFNSLPVTLRHIIDSIFTLRPLLHQMTSILVLAKARRWS